MIQYRLMVGDLYLVGEDYTGRLPVSTTPPSGAFFTMGNAQSMTAYEFTEDESKAGVFDRTTLLGYIEGILERQVDGIYPGRIEALPSGAAEGFGNRGASRAAAQLMAHILENDIVEVIRCKKCTHWMPEETVCEGTGICNQIAEVTDSEFFCAYGRRQQNDTEN